jgi:hypothetical protein
LAFKSFCLMWWKVGIWVGWVWYLKCHRKLLNIFHLGLLVEKPSLQSKFTVLKSKFFPAKIPFSKIQKKILAGKIYFAKEWILLCNGTRSFIPIIGELLVNRWFAENEIGGFYIFHCIKKASQVQIFGI